MAHFAQIENNIVTQVIVISNDVITVDGIESEQAGIDFCKSLYGEDTEWVQTSYSGNIRKNYASVGSTYLRDQDVFVPHSPYPSWTLDDSFNWVAPVPYPGDPHIMYFWSEATQSWVERL